MPPFSLQKSNNSVDKWVLWLLIKAKQRWYLEYRIRDTKYSMYQKASFCYPPRVMGTTIAPKMTISDKMGLDVNLRGYENLRHTIPKCTTALVIIKNGGAGWPYGPYAPFVVGHSVHRHIRITFVRS